MKTTTLALKHSTNCGPFRLALLLIPFALACFAPAPIAQAICQQGCGVDFSNTSLGDDALPNNTGVDNTAVGAKALRNNNSNGVSNTAIGSEALLSNTGGSINTVLGSSALSSNTTGGANTATGSVALASNTTGIGNTANGASALFANRTGFANTAMDSGALSDNNGDFNTATGDDALSQNLTGGNNTANGALALEHNTSGSGNIALGFAAGNNLTSGSNNIYIGSRGTFSKHRTIRIGDPSIHGRTSIAGINGVTVAGGVGVIVDTNGQLGTVVSSERFKDDVKPMDKTSEAILALQPVTFRYKKELDPNNIPQFGLIAEDVEKVNPDLVARNNEGKAYTVRYEAVNAMLLNEFLKEHRKVQDLERNAVRQQKQIEALTAGLQRVSAQLEIMKPTPQTVANNH